MADSSKQLTEEEIRSFRWRLKRLFRSFGVRIDEIEDYVQDAFLLLVRSFDRDRSKNSWAFLRLVARQVHSKEMARKRSKPGLNGYVAIEHCDTEENPLSITLIDSKSLAAIEQLILQDMINKELSETEMRALELKVLEGYGTRKIAALMGVTHYEARKYLDKTKKTLGVKGRRKWKPQKRIK